MVFLEKIFYLFLTLVIIYVFYRFFMLMRKAEREYNKDLEERLNDEFIYDPDTGARLTLEEAESGHWIHQNNQNRIKSDEEIKTHYFGKERDAEELVNYIKSIGFKTTKLHDSQIDFLEQSKILSKYDSWTYSDSFTFNNGKNIFFLTNVAYFSNRHQRGYNEQQIMIWIKNSNLTGHVYLREKTIFEIFTETVRKDDEIKLNNYETFIFKKPNNILQLITTLKYFEAEKNLEIEINDGNLFIKTIRYTNLNDFLNNEKILINVC